MKYIIIALLLFTSVSFSQSIERQVIGSSGNTLSNGTVSLDFTVGELAVTTITDGSVVLTQGFHQANVLLEIKINPKMFLSGPSISSGLMNDALRSNGFLDTLSPYTDALTVNATVFDVTGSDAIVDWVWIELRDGTSNTTVSASRSALLQRDGDVVDLDGSSPISFKVADNDYYVVINHRNHLGAMTLNPISLSGVTATVDFTSATLATYGTNAQRVLTSGSLGLWGGDATGNGQTRYLGPGNDLNNLKNFILSDPGNTTNSTSYPVNGYSNADVNLNGQARFLGPGNDNNIIKSIILANPANTSGSSSFPLTQQIPQ